MKKKMTAAQLFMFRRARRRDVQYLLEMAKVCLDFDDLKRADKYIKQAFRMYRLSVEGPRGL